ncbi:hypothetical protein [Erythrobacter neustonensis]|nr:hypothetical protein [Erythrobacter neustonensis]
MSRFPTHAAAGIIRAMIRHHSLPRPARTVSKAPVQGRVFLS